MVSLLSFIQRFRARPLEGRDVSCDLCGGNTTRDVGHRDRFGAPLTNVVCLDCGLVYTNPMPTDAALAGYYKKDYRLHYQGARGPRAKHLMRGMRRAQGRLDLIAPYLAPGSRLLDIGAGAGEFVAAAAAHGYSASGVEPSVSFAAFARKHFKADVREGEWQALDPAERFDLVSMHHVLEHLAQPRAAFLHVRSLLRDGGLFYVSVPNVLDAERSPHGRWHVGHVHNFGPATLDALAAATGYRPIAGESTTRIYRKVALPDAWKPDAAVARDSVAALARHTALRHFAGPRPYLRFLERGWRHTRETLEAYRQRRTSVARPGGPGAPDG